MAILTSVNITGSEFLQLPRGTTAQRLGNSTPGFIRINTDLLSTPCIEMYDGNNWKVIVGADGTSPARAVQKSTEVLAANPNAPTGWYWMLIAGKPRPVYINNTFEGGGWVLVAGHPLNVAFPSIRYSMVAQSMDYYGSSGFIAGCNDPKDYAVWMGLAGWNQIVSQNQAGRNVVYYASSSRAELNETHSRRSKWTWTGWSGTYAWQGASNLVNQVGGETPGFYSYHIANGYSFTTFDVDQDAHPGNCATYFNNAPFWYGACWDGSFWGGNGAGNYTNASFWTGSGANSYNYGAIYVK
jgi:hypothetical protein